MAVSDEDRTSQSPCSTHAGKGDGVSESDLLLFSIPHGLTEGRSLQSGVGCLLNLCASTFLAQPDATRSGPCLSHVNEELSTASSETEDGPPGLPAPLRPKELQTGQDFHGLLER